MTNENGDDGVEAGIREWRKTKSQAEEAIEKARVAEQDATFVRGQLDVLERQKKADDAKIKAMEGHVAEMNLLVDTLGSAVLSILEKRKAGMFRRPGSVRDGGERVAAIRNGDNAASGDGDRNAELGAEGPDRAGKFSYEPGAKPGRIDMGKLERDIGAIPEFLSKPAGE
jgi:hypothetical protein